MTFTCKEVHYIYVFSEKLWGQVQHEQNSRIKVFQEFYKSVWKSISDFIWRILCLMVYFIASMNSL